MTEWRRGQDNRASLVHGAVAMCRDHFVGESLALPRTPLPRDDVNFSSLTSKSTTYRWATLHRRTQGPSTSLGMTEYRNCRSSEDQAVGLAQEVPGFAVVGVGVAAGVAFGTEEQ